MAYTGRRHPHAKVQSVSSKKDRTSLSRIELGSDPCKAEAFTTELQSSCLMAGEFTHNRICEKLDQESVWDCLSGKTLMPANHKVRCAKSYQDDMQKVKSVSSKKTGRRYRGLNSGPITCKAKAFTTELHSSCLMSGEFTHYRICGKLDQRSVRDCLSGETLMLAISQSTMCKVLTR